MPYSSPEGKDWLKARIVALAPSSILDVGAGSGTYADLLRPALPGAEFTAIEVHEPYVDRFGLREKYDQVLVDDVRAFNNLPLADVVILGDVLEHVRLTEAYDLWDKARGAAKLAVFLSLPIVSYPQGETEGNVHEAHLQEWSHFMVEDLLPGISASWTGPQIGVYQADPA